MVVYKLGLPVTTVSRRGNAAAVTLWPFTAPPKVALTKERDREVQKEKLHPPRYERGSVHHALVVGTTRSHESLLTALFTEPQDNGAESKRTSLEMDPSGGDQF